MKKNIHLFLSKKAKKVLAMTLALVMALATVGGFGASTAFATDTNWNVTAKDTNGNPLQGITFLLKDPNGHDYYVYNTTNAEGKATNSIHWEETVNLYVSSPQKYTLASPISLYSENVGDRYTEYVLRYVNGQPYTGMVNATLVDRSMMNVTAVDADGNPVSGVSFELVTRSDNPVNITVPATDENGKTSIDVSTTAGDTYNLKVADGSIYRLVGNTPYATIHEADGGNYLDRFNTNPYTGNVNVIVEKTFAVTVNNPANSHITLSTQEGNGAEEQTELTGPMTSVIYTADEGYYFPENYTAEESNGIAVTRDSDTQITVSGTPTADATITLPVATKKADQTPEPTPTPAKPSKPTPTTNPQLTATAHSATVVWTKITGADGYYIYGAQCGKDLKKLKTIKNVKTTKWTQKHLKNGKNYKYVIKAYKKVGKKVKVVNTSLSMHVATTGSKKTNAKKVTANFSSATLKIGKTKQIKAKIIKQDPKKPLLSHVSKFRYRTNNKKIATVTKSGKIKAVGKGKCYIYVYANNGVNKKITINVK